MARVCLRQSASPIAADGGGPPPPPGHGLRISIREGLKAVAGASSGCLKNECGFAGAGLGPEITNKLKRGTFTAIFFLACIAALELEQVVLEEI
jgi:hypothetical protein